MVQFLTHIMLRLYSIKLVELGGIRKNATVVAIFFLPRLAKTCFLAYFIYKPWNY